MGTNFGGNIFGNIFPNFGVITGENDTNFGGNIFGDIFVYISVKTGTFCDILVEISNYFSNEV